MCVSGFTDTLSAGAQRVLYAFLGPLSFSTVLTYFEGAEPEKIADVICKRSIYRENRVFVARDFAWKYKIVSRLLKVVETQFFLQNDRNSRLYISTYNNPKL